MGKWKKKKKNERVPEVVRRLFGHKARPLSQTILSLLPPPPSPGNCLCRGRGCLACSSRRLSFLLRPSDSSLYRHLLNHSFLVVSPDAPPLSPFSPLSRWPQNEIVRRTIEMMACAKRVDNVLCSHYVLNRDFNPALELLASPPWDVLLSRVGDDLMIYLLRNTSIFLPVSHMKYHQVAGPSATELCFKMLKCSSKFDSGTNSLSQGDMQKKRKRAGDIDSTTGKRKSCISVNENDPASLVNGADIIGVESSMPMVSNHAIVHPQKGFVNIPKSTIGTDSCNKVESEGEKSSNYVVGRLGKRSRPFRWQRLKRRRQSNLDERGCLPEHFYCNETSLNQQVKMPWQCPCCLIFKFVSTFPKRTEINRRSIFYNSEPSSSVLPERRIPK